MILQAQQYKPVREIESITELRKEQNRATNAYIKYKTLIQKNKLLKRTISSGDREMFNYWLDRLGKLNIALGLYK